MDSEYKNYTKDDIIYELFEFTDALIDEGVLDDKEIELLDKLNGRFYELCQKGE